MAPLEKDIPKLSRCPQFDALGVLTNYLSPKVYQYVEDHADYDSAMGVLQDLYVKPTNEVYAHHLLATRRQQPAETLDEYLQALKTLSKDCNYRSATAVLYREESIRDAFITGLTSGLIHQGCRITKCWT